MAEAEIDLKILGQVLHELAMPYMESQDSVISRVVTDPPAGPVDGDRYIVPAGAGGEWTSHPLCLAWWANGQWNYRTPTEGTTLWIDDEDVQLVFNGSGWQTVGGGNTTFVSRHNKGMQALVTTLDGSLATQIAVQRKPVVGTHIAMLVNGVDVGPVGDNTRTNVACYLSADGGASALAWSAVDVGATIHWNASVGGYSLSETDIIDLVYVASEL